MKIKKILVSQPKPESDKSPYYDLAKKNGVEVEFRQFIQVEPISSKDFRTQKVNILDHTGIVFTSKIAIDHFFRLVKEIRITVPETMKYFCNSESTAFYLQKYIVYRKRKIFHSEGKLDELLDIILKHSEEKYFIPVSDIMNQELCDKLDQNGIAYSKAVLYKTINSNISDIKTNDYDVMVFFSPQGISSLKSNFPDFEQNGLVIASFGSATAKAVEDAGLRLDIQAPMPEAPSMIMALEQYIKKINKDSIKKGK